MIRDFDEMGEQAQLDAAIRIEVARMLERTTRELEALVRHQRRPAPRGSIAWAAQQELARRAALDDA